MAGKSLLRGRRSGLKFGECKEMSGVTLYITKEKHIYFSIIFNHRNDWLVNVSRKVGH